MAGDIGERFVTDNPAARNILVLRFRLAPSGERFQPPEHCRIASGGTNAAPGKLQIVGIVRRIGKLIHLCIQPVTAISLDKLFQHLGKDCCQICYIANGVFDLPISQRATAPISKARALVDGFVKPAFDEVGIADLF